MKFLKGLLIAAALLFSSPALAGYAPVAIPTTANPTSTLTRPADTAVYAVLDNIATNTAGGSASVPSFTATATAACSFDLSAAIMSWNSTAGMDGVSITVRFFSTAPTYAAGNGDNGVYLLATNADKLIGKMTCYLEQHTTAAVGACFSSFGFPSSIKLASGSTVFWDMQTNTIFTPQSGKIATLTPMLKQDAC